MFNRFSNRITHYTLLISISLLAGVSTTCDYATPVKLKGDEFLIFGHFYGECTGEHCVEIYRLNPESLDEDTNDFYPVGGEPSDFAETDFVELPDSIFLKVKDITKRFPSDLHNVASGTVFGNPDEVDQGGIYVEINNKKTHRYWIFDQDKEKYPDYFHDFVDAVNEYIGLINE